MAVSNSVYTFEYGLILKLCFAEIIKYTRRYKIMARNKLKEIQAIGKLYAFGRCDQYNTDYLVLFDHVRKALDLEPSGKVSIDEHNFLDTVLCFANEHLKAVEAMMERCKLTKLACSGGFRGVATKCRCEEIRDQVDAVISLIRSVDQESSPEQIIQHAVAGLHPSLHRIYSNRRNKWLELDAIHTLYVVRRPSLRDTDHLAFLNHLKIALGFSNDLKQDEADVLQLLNAYILENHLSATKHMKDNCTETNLACSGGWRGVATNCRCEEIHKQVRAVYDLNTRTILQSSCRYIDGV